MKSDLTMEQHPESSNEPGPSDSKCQVQKMGGEVSKQHPAMMPKPSDSRRKRSTCDLTEEPPRCAVLTDPVSDPIIVQMDVSLQDLSKAHMIILEERLEGQREDITGPGTGTPFNRIYTELYLIGGDREGVNQQHEVWQLEMASKMETTLLDTTIMCSDIFCPLPGTVTPIRIVLTKGIAGIGKTFSVYKFTLDWAGGVANQHIDLLILISFRKLNLVRDKQYNLLTLIHDFHPTLKKLTAEQLAVCKTVFIFDGLDESRISLNFHYNDIVSDVTVTSSVGILLTNLIQGNLLPSALLWITTRPAAANQIPPACVDRVTEVRGFTDPQKEEYFWKRFSDEKLASRIISHINKSMTLHVMCHIPLFCSITATVLENMLKTDETGQLPKTLTQMLCHFLLVLTKRKKQKYGDEVNQQEIIQSDLEVLLKLGRLAFEHLEKGSIMFYQEDLEECGLDVTEASLYSGVCTEIFKREGVLFQRQVYSFVHLSIQEFLAAVYLFRCFTEKNIKVLKSFLKDSDSSSSLDDFLSRAMLKAQKSINGHLDLFVRFLHGLSLESNQSLLGGLLGQTKNSPEIIQRAIERGIKSATNIYCCLIELGVDPIQVAQMQQFLMSNNRSEKELSEPCRHTSHSMEGRLSSDKADRHQSNTDIATSSQSTQTQQTTTSPQSTQTQQTTTSPQSTQTQQTTTSSKSVQSEQIHNKHSFKFRGPGSCLTEFKVGPNGYAEVNHMHLSPQECICLSPLCDITPICFPPETGAGPSQSNALTRNMTTEGAGMLLSVREGFIARVSDPVLDGLLDRLFTLKVLNDAETDSISAKKTQQKKARQLIDTVQRKGNEASSEMINALKEKDPYLHKQLFDKP